MKAVILPFTLILIFASVVTIESSRDPNFHTLNPSNSTCGPAFDDRCYCHRTHYVGLDDQYVVNCTNSGFSDVNLLSQLPNETQVLIFTGNELNVLPWNVFGTLDRMPYLKVIDMSNNKIREISGKAYHHVRKVERLILDFNELSLNPARDHPRLFSNFISLLELHLTDAFEDDSSENLASTLHNIFVNSNLTRLIKLHLEQNEISKFRDVNVFCDLPSLLDLHLGDNALSALSFNLSCIRNLRFLDLRRNKFTTLHEHDLSIMNDLAKHNRSITVDFSANPFECSCKLNPFIAWLRKTKFSVQNRDIMRCQRGNESYEFYKTRSCHQLEQWESHIRNWIIAFALFVLLIVVPYVLIRAYKTKRSKPMVDSVNKSIRYTSITTGDGHHDV